MTQGGQMSKTCNTAGPNCLNTAAVPRLSESLQVPHQGVGEFVQGEGQLVVWFPLTVCLRDD